MEIIQLLSFYQIVKTGSFSKASRNVFRSQSAVSHQIRKLEEECNVKLFERLGKKVKLTDEGKILFDTVSYVFTELDNVKRRFEDMRQSKYGSLAIATIGSVMTYVLPDVIKRFRSQFPGIKLKLVACSLISDIQSIILDGNADFGIGPRSKQPLPRNLDFLFWKSFDRVLITAKTNPLRQIKRVTLFDISKYPIISYKKDTIIRKDLEEVFGRSNASCDIVMEVDVTEHIKNFVEMGIGISILPSLTLSKEDRARFHFSNVDYLFGKTDYGIYYRSDKYINSAMKQFIKLFAPELYDKFRLE